jgi:CRISPR-associated endonuclease/helicase Cas3
VIRPDVFGEQFVVLDDMDLYTDAVGLDWTDPTFMEGENQVC